MAQTRNTQQRQLILDLMTDNFTHPTADEIYTQVRQRDPKISRGTVYRNLNLLSEQGVLRRLTMPVGPDHYDWNMTNHYHFLCKRCYKVFDTPIRYKESLNETPDEMSGFQTEWHRLLLVGLCPECLKKAQAMKKETM